MILSAIAAKLKQRAEGDFKGRHYEAALIVQAVSCRRLGCGRSGRVRDAGVGPCQGLWRQPAAQC